MHCNEGVCKVIAVGELEFDNAESGALYYTLEPFYGMGKLYTPVDSPVFMRRALTGAQAQEFLDGFLNIPIDPNRQIIPNTLGELFRSCIQTEDLLELATLLRQLAWRREDNLQSGRKNPKIEDNYIRRSIEVLGDELAFALEAASEDIRKTLEEWTQPAPLEEPEEQKEPQETEQSEQTEDTSPPKPPPPQW